MGYNYSYPTYNPTYNYPWTSKYSTIQFLRVAFCSVVIYPQAAFEPNIPFSSSTLKRETSPKLNPQIMGLGYAEERN